MEARTIEELLRRLNKDVRLLKRRLVRVGGGGASTPAGAILQFAGASAPNGWLICDGSAVSRETYASLFAAIGTTYGAGNGSTTFNLPNLKGRVPVGRDAAQTEFDALGETGGAKAHTLTVGEMPSHTHTQNSHNHTQNSHNHTQNSHSHQVDPPNTSSATSPINAEVTTQVTSTNPVSSNVYIARGASAADPGIRVVRESSHSHDVNIALFNSGGTTAVNQAATATNNAATATNQNTGGGDPHNNLQPYLVLNHIIKA